MTDMTNDSICGVRQSCLLLWDISLFMILKVPKLNVCKQMFLLLWRSSYQAIVIVQCQPAIRNSRSQLNLYSEVCLIILCLSAAGLFLRHLLLRGWQRFTLPVFVQQPSTLWRRIFPTLCSRVRSGKRGDVRIIRISAEVPVLFLFLQEGGRNASCTELLWWPTSLFQNSQEKFTD